MSTTAAVVTIPTGTFATWAAGHADEAAHYATEASVYLLAVKERAARTSPAWRSRLAGNDAAGLVRLAEVHEQGAQDFAALAAKEADDAANAETVTAAAWAEDAARISARAAKHERDATRRMIDNFPA